MKLRFVIRLGCLTVVMIGWLIANVTGLMAQPPHNDDQDNSVAEVVLYHKASEPRPETIEYISWSKVTVLQNGRYKVTVVFLQTNTYDRIITRKQIVILDDSGRILRTMDCR